MRENLDHPRLREKEGVVKTLNMGTYKNNNWREKVEKEGKDRREEKVVKKRSREKAVARSVGGQKWEKTGRRGP